MLTMLSPILDKSLYTAKKSGDSITRVTVRLLSRRSYCHAQNAPFLPPIQKSGSYPTRTHKSDCCATWSKCGGIGIRRKLPLTEQYRQQRFEKASIAFGSPSNACWSARAPNPREYIDEVNKAEGDRVLVRKPIQEKIYGEAPPRIGSSADPYEPLTKPAPFKPAEGFAAEVNIPAPENQTVEYTEQKIPERLKDVETGEPKADVEVVNNSSIDNPEESGIIEKGRMASASGMEPPDFSKYEVKVDYESVERVRQFIIDELGVEPDNINLDGIKNADVLEPFFKRIRTIQKATGMKMPPIITLEVIERETTCIADYKPYDGHFYISSLFFNSKKALIDALNSWRSIGEIPMQMKNIVYIAEHECAHIRIPDRILETKEAYDIWLKRSLADRMESDIYEYYANATAIYRMNPQTNDSAIIKAINYLKKEGVVI